MYHIPTYLFWEFPGGEKKPSSNIWPEDTKVVLLSSSLIDWVDVMVSAEKERSKKKIGKMINNLETFIDIVVL